MKDPCNTRVRKDDEGYYALQITDLTPKDPDSAANNAKMMSQLGEVTQRLEQADKELNEARAALSNNQRQLKE
ncbi:hypothetical protein GW17_00013559 [Ensete ventricosum]|nr:hypothetical protein GW17_00013559 [Ensete ventricosum]RZR81765.1 hypothetical protein BHM03_00008060 [Ensete ventricosum]